MKTLKRFFKTIILSVIVFTLFYLMGSFVELTFNIFDWSRDARIAVGILGGMFSIAIAGLIISACD